MKKHDFILLIGVVLIAAISFVFYHYIPRENGAFVEISINQKIYKTLPLDENRTLDIPSSGNHNNRLVIKNAKAYITSADCPDKLCVHQKKISHNGETLICLPHKVVITVKSKEKSKKSLDSIAS